MAEHKNRLTRHVFSVQAYQNVIVKYVKPSDILPNMAAELEGKIIFSSLILRRKAKACSRERIVHNPIKFLKACKENLLCSYTLRANTRKAVTCCTTTIKIEQ